MSEAKKKPRLQCEKCPWKKSTNPREIPKGYTEEAHAALSRTIAERDTFNGTAASMACHESEPGKEVHCVGWLVHQLNEGGNLALRMRAIAGTIDCNVRTVGPQHARFEDTLPKKRRRRTGST